MSDTPVDLLASVEARADRATGGMYGWIATVDHKRIGLLYLLTALVFFAIGGGEALLMRVQLSRPNNTFLSPQAYNQMFTLHGTTMIFLVVMPTLIGLANYLVPLMIGARDMAFPRLNALGYWLLPCGGLLLHFSLMAGGAPAVGWFSYAPLSEAPYASTAGVDYWSISLLILGIGSVVASINLIATVLTLRAPGLTIRRLPLFVWMVFVTAFLIILAMPALNAAIVMLFIDRHLDTHFFVPSHGGSALLWQHFFWAFGHPEVYILALPAFGIISEVIPVFSRRPIFGYEFVAGSTVAIALLSFGVWAHHMFAVGLGHPMDLFFAATSMLIAVPTGIKVFAWSATMWGGSIRLTTAMLFAVAFLIQFTIGGLSGITFAVVPIDWQVTDTYYLVAHLHYVLFGGTLFAIFSGTYYWFPKFTGRMLSEGLGKLNFWTMLIGFNMTFFVQHILGLMGMTRRIYTYPDLPGWGLLNFISTVGAFLLGASMLVLVWNIILTLRRGKAAGDNPWQAWTLEWATTSPPPAHNFDRLPPIHSRRPLRDLAHPENPDPPVGSTSDDGFFVEKNSVAMIMFLISEGVFFLLLVLTYLFFNSQSMAGTTAANTLNPGRAGIYTLCLLASSLTIWLAERKLKAKQHIAFRWLLGLTIVLGVVFICGQGMEYLHILHSGVMVNSNLFATTFFTVTGMHGLHVCVGLIALLIVMGLAFAGDFKAGRMEALKSVGLYWHFVDIVWLVVFSVIYLRLLLMTTSQLFISAWSWSPWVITACGAMIVGYFASFGLRGTRKLGWLLVGVMMLFFTLASPIDALADGYLFSAHMLQHLLLLLIVPPLLLLSLPQAQIADRPQHGAWKSLNWIFCHPLVPWLLGVGGMWLWHAPILCDAAVTNVTVHRLQYVSLLLMGGAFWWPIVGPFRQQRLSPLAGILYLFSACVGCTILGIIITFAPVEVCSIYLHPVDRLDVLPLLQGQWGLTPARDQQIGGLLMWVPACLIYFCGILRLLARWFAGNGAEAVLSGSQKAAVLTGVTHAR